MSESIYWVYILLCENDAFYTGYTDNLLRRYREHVKGTSKSKYTRSFKPQCLLQSWMFAEKSIAMKMESFIKTLNKSDKKQLIAFPEKLADLYAQNL